MSIQTKLNEIQTKLKAPKGQYNNFGKYKYRSLEDITEAVKPLLLIAGATLTLQDDIKEIGGRIYVEATATLTDIEDNSQVSVKAFARESETKKGMDDSQITGTASSYARKYALNGLFAIDDTKDADTDEYTARSKQTKERQVQAKPLTKERQVQAKPLTQEQKQELADLKIKAMEKGVNVNEELKGLTTFEEFKNKLTKLI